VQALVLALLTWCVAVFVFDLVALGVIVSTQSAKASTEIEFVCDATHVNTAADLHSSYDHVAAEARRAAPTPEMASAGWLAINPVDLFRALNLPQETGVRVPVFTILLAAVSWLALPLGTSMWKLRRTDL
jgi:type IV secretory pathway TrbD component